MFSKRRLGAAIAATVVLGLMGGAGGYQVGRRQTEQITWRQLDQGARQTGEPFAALLDESTSLLNQLEKSPFPPCSEAEIAHFRRLLFHSEYLRDAGRMKHGVLQCSTLFSRDQLAKTPIRAAISTEDGLSIYRDIPPWTSSKWVVFLLRRGDFYVVEDLSAKNNWHPPDQEYESTLLDQATGKRLRPGGRPLLAPEAVLDRTVHARVGDLLYSTVCWPRNSFCTTVFASWPRTLREQRDRLVVATALGAGGSVTVLLIFLVFYHRSRNLTQQLRRAIRADGLQLVYQPIVDLSTGRVVEAEALARWTDEEGFDVSPEIFVRLATERGFVHELTEWVVRRALADFSRHLQRHPDFRLNINVTAADLVDRNFLPMLDRNRRESMVAARSLAIEIIEGSTARRPIAVETVRKLRALGHSVQVDDFGTGYSSLAYLKDLDVDAIKIDKAFTQTIGTDAVTVAILPQILALAESLNLLVIVEGIETEDQAAYFSGRKQPIYGQGWFFGRPVPAEVFLQHADISPFKPSFEGIAAP
jgi:sensor c-di-GMP phosphodiesterase-like protein